MKEILQWLAIAVIYIALILIFASALHFGVHTQVSYVLLVLIFVKLFSYGDK